LQAGSDRTLKRMLRRHTIPEYLEKVDMLRTAIPEIALSTDIIAAFPGETTAEFDETLHLLRSIQFDDVFTYRFSPRDGTPATRFPAEDAVPEDEGRRRLDELIEVARKVQAEVSARDVGRVDEVLVEKLGRDAGFVFGKTRRGKAVTFCADASSIGSYRMVRLDRTTGATFIGSEVLESEPAWSA